MKPFQINFLDHVALQVRDQEESVRWHQKVLGLQRANFPE
ncbi:VOC family protein [Adhaeribacter aquaticus]|nr:VOC family protein [Adhaeribacter aquaticus]